MSQESDVRHGRRWGRYVAVGDSMTEGLWGENDAADRPTGWADLLAAELSARRVSAGEPPLEYANLAVRGRLLRPILTEQLPAALRFDPDLVSIVGGGNDMLRPTVDVDVLARNLEAAVVKARATGADVLLATGMDAKDSPVVRRTRSRVGVFNAHIWTIARRHGAHVVDVWGMRSLRDWRMWAPDRIHLNADGHARVARAALRALGIEASPDWDAPLTPLPPPGRLEAARSNAQWAREWAVPWATRRLRRRSSGDLVSAKRPVPEPIAPGHAIDAR